MTTPSFITTILSPIATICSGVMSVIGGIYAARLKLKSPVIANQGHNFASNSETIALIREHVEDVTHEYFHPKQAEMIANKIEAKATEGYKKALADTVSSERRWRIIAIGFCAIFLVQIVLLIVSSIISAGNNNATVSTSTPEKRAPGSSLSTPKDANSASDSTTFSSAVIGAWSGKIRQDDGPEWPVELTLPDKSREGTISYKGSYDGRNIDCSGSLTLINNQNDAVFIREQITAGACTKQGMIVLTPLPNGNLGYYYSSSNAPYIATTQLTRSSR